MKKTTGKILAEVGAGLAAVGAAAAAGYYFYGSDNAKKHRKVVVKWADDMKKEVLKEAKRLGSSTPKAFAVVVDRVAKTYEGARAIDTAEVKRAAKELKANWDMIQHEAKRTVRKSVSRAKATAKRIK